MLDIILDSRRIDQVCKPNGWRKPDHVDIKCKRDGKFKLTLSRVCCTFRLLEEIDLKISLVDEIAAELENLKISLVNNNLLNSCTIEGVTNDWYQYADDVVAVEGIF